MTLLPERFASEAERMLGAPFRLRGRNPEHGVDCVGLVICALEQSGHAVSPPAAYALKNTGIESQLDCVRKAGFIDADGPVQRGDVILVRPGPAQHHLLIALGFNRFIHAHAGLRRVVIQTGLDAASILRRWRLFES